MNCSLSKQTNQSSCPFNEFCSSEAAYLCKDQQLASCKYCNVSIAYFLFAIYFLMAIAIFIANGMIIAVYAYQYTKKIVAKSDPIRISLAIADILTGVQIFAMILPEISQKIMSTGSEQIDFRCSSKKDAWQCGALLIFSFSSSLYHLILFGIQRLSAIIWPWKYQQSSFKSVYISLIFVWLAAGFTAAIPGIFSIFYYCRRFSLCLVCSKDIIAYITLYTICLFLPFFVMTVITCTTGIVAHNKLKSSLTIRKNTSGDSHSSHGFTAQQATALKTVAFMQVGFTLSVGPAILGILLGSLNVPCEILDPYETACYILFFSNSLVNAIVYSVRDPKFRENVVHLLVLGKHFACGSKKTDFPTTHISNLSSNGHGGKGRPTAA